MRKSNKERQTRWKEKQKSEGRKSVTIMLGVGVKSLIDKERQRAGETIADVVERSVTMLLDPKGYEGPVKRKIKKLIQKDPEVKEICQKVFALRTKDAFGYSPIQLAAILRVLGHRNFIRDEKWSEEEVEAVLDVVTSNDSPFWAKKINQRESLCPGTG